MGPYVQAQVRTDNNYYLLTSSIIALLEKVCRIIRNPEK